MGKQHDGYVTICLFMFMSLASQIQCRSQTHGLNNLRPKGAGDASSVSHINQQGQKERDRIEKLPGQPPVNFKQYGGYVTVDESAGRVLFYYFVESTNASAPLVLWLNGGPGCSSLGVGAMTGLGPFRVHSDGKTLYSNEYAWNNAANILFLESPADVGFSYTNTTSALKNQSDGTTARDSHVFLLKWLERFPEYKTREFYLTGESYAGHYIPQLAQTILQNNNKTFINLQGIMIGNPALDEDAELIGQWEFLEGHSIISTETLLNLKKYCQGEETVGNTPTECKTALDEYHNCIKDINLYNIYAPMCLNQTLTLQPNSCTTVMDFDPCSKHYVEAYLNREDVKEALHAVKTRKWEECASSRDDYNKDEFPSVIPVLKELVNHEGIRIWIYSGDVDAAVPFTGTVYTLKKLNLTVEKIWFPWLADEEIGGYTEEYKEKFRFATVRGAGHEVPSYQPKAVLTLFKHFILNKPLPSKPYTFEMPS